MLGYSSRPVGGLLLLLLIIWPATSVYGQDAPPSVQSGAVAPSAVEVVVFGSPHLRQLDLTKNAIATELVLASLAEFAPDLVVVEWLHPSVDRSTAFNYRDLGDQETLGRLWGYRTPERVQEAFAETMRLLDIQQEGGLETGATRIELGKLFYLRGDQLNAGYQWWRAQQLGANVADLRRLTRNNFLGHELEVWGFELARRGGHEYVTPFDYQGTDIGSEVWGQIIGRLRAHAVALKHGVREGQPEWEELAGAFDDGRKAFERGESVAWLNAYGDIAEVREYATAWEGFGLNETSIPADRDGLGRIRWWQSAEYEAIERKIQYELIPGISIDGLGQARTNGNIRRNEHMADFAEADIKRLGARKVLIIVGFAHKHYLEDILGRRGYVIVDSAELIR